MKGSWANDEERERTRTVANRAIRRLELLEWFLFGAAAVAAVAGGGLLALVLQDLFGMPFQKTWIGASILLFLIPAAAARFRARSR